VTSPVNDVTALGRRRRVRVVPPITDEELAAEAMAADPGAPVPDDAVPFDGDGDARALLPEWYMPVPSLRRTRSRVVVFTGVAISMAFGNIAGFCVTNGFPEFVFR
jgi:hypothetical protein